MSERSEDSKFAAETASAPGPWNPGISSTLPPELRPLITMMRSEHIFETLSELDELAEFSGQKAEAVATFRPLRLAAHETLIRVTADYTVSDGNEYEDLGNNFRAMAGALFEDHVLPNATAIEARYAELRGTVEGLARSALAPLFVKPQPITPERSWWQWFRQPAPSTPAPVDPVSQVDQWNSRSREALRSELDRAVDAGLAHVVNKLLIQHGRIQGEVDLVARLVTSQVMNEFGSEQIGRLIQPWLDVGAEYEGFRRLPVQDTPVVLNVTGASAAGKSTLRPLQQRMVVRLGLVWADFALISPDIFRKFLLDYESLGEDYKYAGTLSGQELQVVDQKLDRYIANKARQGALTHLLIDRFRFDSFTLKSPEQGSNLLTRFGARVFMFFVITPPHATVERAWKRGLQVGRFKAVDDLLDHNIEAFNGMPDLFFTWALAKDKDVYYEFLDNSVEYGERPRTIAFGRNGSLLILDPDRLMDIDRFQKLNVNAIEPGAVYTHEPNGSDMDKQSFLIRCVSRLNQVEFAEFETGARYARITQGKRALFDQDRLNNGISDSTLRRTVSGLLNSLPAAFDPDESEPLYVGEETLGARGAH